MSSSTQTLARMNRRVKELSNSFDHYLDVFQNSEPFIGPSVYFHNKTLEVLRNSSSARQALQTERFYEYLYATLTAWGMHRMGPGNTKLRNLDEITNSLQTQADKIERLEGISIFEVKDAHSTARELWSILSCLQISIADFQIVANSKALHHLLPALVPPIDRTYTFCFFYTRTQLSISEEDAFREMYLQFCYIANTNKQQIKSCLGKGWNTSETKVIDNAIVGFIQENGRCKGNG